MPSQSPLRSLLATLLLAGMTMAGPAHAACPSGQYEEDMLCVACGQWPCPPGSYNTGTACDGNGVTDTQTCSSCPLGTFSSSSGQSVCQDCSPGTFNSSSGQSTCQDCSPGSFSSSSGQSVCEDCSLGTFSSSSGQSTCQDCSPGSFSSSSGQSVCQDCPLGTFGSSSGQSTCQNCSPGFFSSTAGQTSCQSCGVGTFSNASAQTSCQDCSAGTFSNASAQTSCQDCSAGTYNNTTAQSTCQDCAAGTFSTVQAATTSSVCTECAAQTFQDMAGSSECLDCPTGTEQPETGATECTDRNRRRCWKAKDLKNPAFVKQQGLAVDDEFASGSVDVKSPSLFCSPAGLNGQPVANPLPRQCCYKVSGAKLDPAVAIQTVGSQGGTLELGLSKPALLCEQCLGTGSDNPLQCWKVKDLKNPRFVKDEAVMVQDEFATDTVGTVKPDLFCAPAAVDGSPVTDAAAHQCCYKVKGTSLAVPAVVSTSGAEGGTLELELKKPTLVCEPCTVSVLP